MVYRIETVTIMVPLGALAKDLWECFLRISDQRWFRAINIFLRVFRMSCNIMSNLAMYTFLLINLKLHPIKCSRLSADHIHASISSHLYGGKIQFDLPRYSQDEPMSFARLHGNMTPWESYVDSVIDCSRYWRFVRVPSVLHIQGFHCACECLSFCLLQGVYVIVLSFMHNLTRSSALALLRHISIDSIVYHSLLLALYHKTYKIHDVLIP